MLLANSCTDDFEKVNTDPSAYSPASFDPNYMLTTAQLTYTGSIDFAYEAWRGNLIYASTMMQGLSSVVGYWAGDKYLLNEGYTAAYWERAYSEQVKPIVDIVEFTRDDPKYHNLHQVARIWKALVFQRITDLYGNVPYFQAGMGYYTGVLTPVYDNQSDIYADLLKEVDEASSALDASGDAITGDVVYAGDIEKWRKFGYSLLVRLSMRISEVDEESAKLYLDKAQGKTMESNADNAFVLHDATGGRVTQNRNSQVLMGDGGQEHYYVKWSDTFISYLKTNDDPRLSKVAVTNLYLSDAEKGQNSAFITDPEVQKGMPNGKDLSGIASQDIRQDPSFTAFEDYSSPNPAMITKTGPTFVMTYAQTELLLADAAARGWISDAEGHYNNGITAAMTYLAQYDASMEVPVSEAQAYLTANPYNAANGLEMIHTEYWALCNTMLDFYESWSNWRRTGYPELTPVNYPNNATGGTIPVRFPYPDSESTRNKENYEAAQSAMSGGDNLTSHVWWDVD